jgi:hypothetical protein
VYIYIHTCLTTNIYICIYVYLSNNKSPLDCIRTAMMVCIFIDANKTLLDMLSDGTIVIGWVVCINEVDGGVVCGSVLTVAWVGVAEE